MSLCEVFLHPGRIISQIRDDLTLERLSARQSSYHWVEHYSHKGRFLDNLFYKISIPCFLEYEKLMWFTTTYIIHVLMCMLEDNILNE